MNPRAFGSASTTGSADADGVQPIKGKSYEDPTHELPIYEAKNIVHLINEMQDVELNPNQDGEIGLSGRHSSNQPDVSVAKRPSNNWDQVINSNEVIGLHSKPQSSCSWGSWEPASLPSPAISPPPQNGLQSSGSAGLQQTIQVKASNIHPHDESIVVYDPEFENLSQDGDASVDVDDEWVDDSEEDISDGFDSDDYAKSHDIRKKNKWLRPFFESLDNLSSDQLNEQARQWHCPACQDGPGAIDWFTGLQSLMTHSKTKGRIRWRLHREFAELLEEELQRRGTSFIHAGEAFGKWNGLCATPDHEIVWPPMVVVMNTKLEKDENDKWKGMGNQELVEYFSTYEAVKARHSYGPNGHRGMSVLIFEASAMGYLEAERLHKHFLGEGRDRYSWEKNPVLFYPGGKRQLYGFLASKEDVVIFNKHSHGKGRLKFDIKSYQEMVVGPMKKMSTDNQKLFWLKNKVIQHEQCSKALEETFGVVCQNLHDTIEENRIVRLKMKIHHEENKEEMDSQEGFFKDQMNKISDVNEENGRTFETFSQEEGMNFVQSDVSSGTIIDATCRKEDLRSFVACQSKSAEELEAEREKLTRLHEENKVELKRKHLTEKIELEKQFQVHLAELIRKYAPPSFSISAAHE